MRKLIYVLLLTTQTVFATDLDTAKYAVPVQIFDSLTFEVLQGRACTKLSAAQANENAKLEAEIVAQGTVIRLKQSEVTHLEEIIKALQTQSEATKVINKDRLQKLKIRIRKLVAIVAGETVVIVVLVIILL